MYILQLFSGGVWGIKSGLGNKVEFVTNARYLYLWRLYNLWNNKCFPFIFFLPQGAGGITNYTSLSKDKVDSIDQPVEAYSRVYTHRNPWLWLTFCFCLCLNFDHLLLWISFGLSLTLKSLDFRAYPDLAELEVIMLKCKSIYKAKADPKPKLIKIQT